MFKEASQSCLWIDSPLQRASHRSGGPANEAQQHYTARGRIVITPHASIPSVPSREQSLRKFATKNNNLLKMLM